MHFESIPYPEMPAAQAMASNGIVIVDPCGRLAGLMTRPNALVRDCKQAPHELQRLPATLLGQDQRIQGESFLTAEALQVFVDVYQHTGFTAGLNGYRN